jgi:hypothetical protein
MSNDLAEQNEMEKLMNNARVQTSTEHQDAWFSSAIKILDQIDGAHRSRNKIEKMAILVKILTIDAMAPDDIPSCRMLYVACKFIEDAELSCADLDLCKTNAEELLAAYGAPPFKAGGLFGNLISRPVKPPGSSGGRKNYRF